MRVWDAGDGREIAVLRGHLGSVESAAFSPDSQRIFTVAGPEGIIWTKLAAASLPNSVAGLWFYDFGFPEVPQEIVRERCVGSPIKINRDGLIVFFEAVGHPEPPQSIMHLRCASDLTCQVFDGAPGQGVEVTAIGNVAFPGEAGNLCLTGECRPIVRCPALIWTDEERASGFAERWEAAVLGQEK